MSRDGRNDGMHALEGEDETFVVSVVDYADIDAFIGE